MLLPRTILSLSYLFKKNNYPTFFIVGILLFCISCNNDNNTPESKTKEQLLQDSIAFKQEQQHIEDSIAKVYASKKKIYLTWDDGPNNGTNNVYKTVLEEKVPMSFFLVGLHTKDSPEMWRTLKADSTIELCNHSYTHGLRNHYDRFYRQPAVVISDFNRSQDSLHYTNRIARMPGRNAWRISDINYTDVRSSRIAVDSLHAAGYDVMGWDVEWTFNHRSFSPNISADGLLDTIDRLFKENKTKTPGHLVILSHDQAFTKAADVEQLRYFFRKLKENPDYLLQFASQYPGLHK